MRFRIHVALGVIVCAVAVVPTVRADLANEFAGFTTVSEIGVSGLRSSYSADTIAGLPVSGPTVSQYLPAYGPARVWYPDGGEIPSTGGEDIHPFDQGVLGVRVVDGAVIIKLASGLDPTTGIFSSNWNTWYGQGDMFVTTQDSRGISQYALLSVWPRHAGGEPVWLGGHFEHTSDFHLTGGAGGTSLEGHLVRLLADADVTTTGGVAGYPPELAPEGLDVRSSAVGGTDVANGHVTNGAVEDAGLTWYVQTWTVQLSDLSPDATFSLGLHDALTCGNDQIGGDFQVPEPTTLTLVVVGALVLAVRRSR